VLSHLLTNVLEPKTSAALVIYEPINASDSFGRVMTQNLASRGITLPTMESYPSLASQRARMAEYGLKDGGGAVDVDFVMSRWVSEHERERVDRVEMLDEVEEWTMLAQHYCVAWGWREGDGGRGFWKTWNGMESQVIKE